MRLQARPARPPRRQSGLALLVIIGMLGLGATLMLVRALNQAAQGDPRRSGNSRVLEDAKAALIMHVSLKAASESHPGKLPCPEDISLIGTADEGKSQGTCAVPAIGRLPWKTLDMATAPLDLDGEPLWYAISPGFNDTSVTNLVINSDTPAGLTVDGSPARAVALIFSPGRPLSGQSRPALNNNGWLVVSNYLEGENATQDISFATYGPANSSSTTFNDQAVIVTHRDLFSVVEEAVARRLTADMVNGTKPLTGIYPSSWGLPPLVFPYAAPFGSPNTSSFQGASGTTQGLLPVTFSTTADAAQYCNPATDGPRCDPTFVQWISFQSIAKSSGGMTLYASPSPTCSVAASQLSCTIYTNNSGSLTINLIATASNVAMALRQLDPDAPSAGNFSSIGRSASAILNSDGSSRVTFTGRVVSSGVGNFWGCSGAFLGFCYKRTFDIPIRLFADHPIVNSSDSVYGWFTKNEWHKLVYYAIAPELAVSGTQICTSPNCLTINNLGTTPNYDKRAILILAGRPIGAQTHPSSTLSNYLESENASPVDSTFDILKQSSAFNDRVVIVY